MGRMTGLIPIVHLGNLHKQSRLPLRHKDLLKSWHDSYCFDGS